MANASGGYVPGTPAPGNPTDNGGTIPSINPGGSGGGMGNTPTIDPTLGSGSFPWLQRWTGPFSTPMNNTQNSAISGIENFMGGGAGGGGGFGGLYAGGGMSGGGGSYTPGAFHYDPTDFTNMQNSLESLQGLQDSRALQELQSRAAAGGNALSGGLMQQEGDYLRGSNAATQQLMEQARMGDVQAQRALWNQLQQSQIGAAASRFGSMQAAGASRFGSSLQNQLGNRGLDLQSLNDLFRMGTIQQNASNQELSGQYNDWLRQLGGLQNMYQYPDQLAGGMLGNGGYHQTYQQQYSNQSGGGTLADILAMLGGGSGGNGIDWGSILGSGTGTDNTQNADAHEVHYNAQPMSYQDQNFYNSALTAEQAADRTAQTAHPNAGLNAGLGTAGLVMALLKLLGGGGRSGGGRGGGGNGGGSSGRGNLTDLFDKLFGNNNGSMHNYTDQSSGYDTPIGPTQEPDASGFFGLSNNAYENPIGPTQSGDASGFFGLGDNNSYDQPIGPTQLPGDGGFNGLDAGGTSDTWNYGDFGGGLGDGGGGSDF